jgi:hypothetical protein
VEQTKMMSLNLRSTFVRKDLICVAVLLVAALFIYLNGLKNPYMLDDAVFFNEKMRNVRYFWGHFLGEEGNNIFFRPLSKIVPMVPFVMFKGAVVPFHLTNLLLLWAACVSIYVFVLKIFADRRMAFLTAGLYLLHPINGVVVNYLTAGVFSVQVILMLLSLYCACRPSLPHTVCSVLFFVLSLMCHETAMALPFYAAVLWAGLRSGSGEKIALKNVIVLFIAGAFYFLWRMKFASLGNGILGNFSLFHMSVLEYFASWSKLVFWYLRNLIYPDDVVLIYGISVVRSGAAGWVLLGLIFIAALSAAMFYFRRNRAVFTGLSWFAVGSIPFSFACLFQRIGLCFRSSDFFSVRLIYS